jgi:hypothetical protein
MNTQKYRCIPITQLPMGPQVQLNMNRNNIKDNDPFAAVRGPSRNGTTGHQDEEIAKFRILAEAVIDEVREEGERHPVVLLLTVSGPKTFRLAPQLRRKLAAGVRTGEIRETWHPDDNVRAFVMSRWVALSVLQAYGRHALGYDFERDFSIDDVLDPWNFYLVKLFKGNRVDVAVCSPGPVTPTETA